MKISLDRNLVVGVCKLAIAQVFMFYALRWAVKYLDPMRKTKKETKAKATELMKKITTHDLSKLKMNEYEQIIASEIVLPNDLTAGFDDIGGMEETIKTIKETILYPLQFPHIFSQQSNLLSPPRGILLYGPPGCGKTMLAKAIAKESKAAFINLKISTLTEKWFGESQKLVKSVFTLAQKLEPCIIFIDEIDSFLRARQTNDHEVTAMMKAEFMSLWDGLTTDTASRTVIMGATNRPHDIDKAILRRMPKAFHVALPAQIQRLSILKLTLKNVKLSENFDMEKLAKETHGFSGSDLKELCRNAVMTPVREYMGSLENVSALQDTKSEDIPLRPVKMEDFFNQESMSGRNSIDSQNVEEFSLD